MTIRKTTVTILALTTLGLLGVAYLVSSQLIGESFTQLEKQGAREDAERARRALQRLVATTDSYAWDWGSWDDTVRFVQDGNEAFVLSNLVGSVFADQRLNAMVFADPEGHVVWGKGYDLETKKQTPPPPALVSAVRRGGVLHNLSAPSEGLAGVMSLPEGVMVVASRPILDSAGNGPARGMVVMGRFLSEKVLERLRDEVQLFVAFLSPDAARASGRDVVWDAQGRAVVVTDENRMHALARVDGLGGEEVLVLDVEVARPIHALAGRTVRHLAVALLLMGGISCAVTLLLLESRVLWRISSLGSQVAAIGRHRDAARQVVMPGQDELVTLAGNINGMLSELEDARTKASVRLRDLEENEAFMARLFDSIQAGVLLIDVATRTVADANAFALALVGSDLAAFAGRRCYEAFCTRSNGVCPVLDEGEDVSLHVCAMQRADGSTLHILKSVTRVERKGRPYLLETFTDITEMHEAQQALQAAKASLEDEVAARTSQLQEANVRLTELNQLKSTFLSSASHELRTPLTSVLGFLKLSDKKFSRWFEPLARGDPAMEGRAREFKANFAIMELEAERLRRLINDLLDLNRIESNRVQWQDAEVDLGVLLEQIAQSFRPHFEERSEVAFTLRVLSDLPRLRVDPDRITQVVVNLVHNADKFTSHGSISLEAEAVGDGSVWVRVRDTGRGISPEDIDHIFDSFYQSQSERGDQGRMLGTGLGLAICHQIVQHYGGEFGVESELGKGSVFSFSLPSA